MVPCEAFRALHCNRRSMREPNRLRRKWIMIWNWLANHITTVLSFRNCDLFVLVMYLYILQYNECFRCWRRQGGLGRNGHGRWSPMKTVMKNDRKGHGIKDKKNMKINQFGSKDGKSVATTNPFVHAIQKQQYEEALRAIHCNKRHVLVHPWRVLVHPWCVPVQLGCVQVHPGHVSVHLGCVDVDGNEGRMGWSQWARS